MLAIQQDGFKVHLPLINSYPPWWYHSPHVLHCHISAILCSYCQDSTSKVSPLEFAYLTNVVFFLCDWRFLIFFHYFFKINLSWLNSFVVNEFSFIFFYLSMAITGRIQATVNYPIKTFSTMPNRPAHLFLLMLVLHFHWWLINGLYSCWLKKIRRLQMFFINSIRYKVTEVLVNIDKVLSVIACRFKIQNKPKLLIIILWAMHLGHIFKKMIYYCALVSFMSWFWVIKL